MASHDIDEWALNLAGLAHHHFKSVLQFEVEGQGFLAIPQESWSSDDAASTELRALRSHIAGRLRIGARRFVVFSDQPRTTTPSATDSIAEILTRRELCVAMLISKGKTDKEIARHLGISSHTVREHLRRACAKLSISKRSALVALVMNQQPELPAGDWD